MELKPYGRCTVNIATRRTTAIGMLTAQTNAPSRTAKPPTHSTSTVAHAMTWGAGTHSACRIPTNALGPLESFANPCAMKPYPTIRRSGIAHHPIGIRPSDSNSTLRSLVIGKLSGFQAKVGGCPGFQTGRGSLAASASTFSMPGGAESRSAACGSIQSCWRLPVSSSAWTCGSRTRGNPLAGQVQWTLTSHEHLVEGFAFIVPIRSIETVGTSHQEQPDKRPRPGAGRIADRHV